MFVSLTSKSSMYALLLISQIIFSVINIAKAQEPSFINKLNVHGFISQGIIQSKDSNFINDSGDVSAELTEVGVNMSYQISNDIRVTGQAVYLEGGNRYDSGLRVDYALIDWSALNSQHWKVNAYIGRFKNNHWLYSSIRNVPMARPSIVLPQSVYFDGTRDMSVGGDGIAINTQYNSSSLGDFDFNISSGVSPMSEEQTKLVMGESAQGKIDHTRDLQASIYWQPLFSQWRFGFAYTSADFEYKRNESYAQTLPKSSLLEPPNGALDLERFYLNAIYQAETWTISTELVQEMIEVTGFAEAKNIGQGGYVQGQYHILSGLQLMARYEHFYVNKDDKKGYKAEALTGVPHYFGYQHDTTIGLTYDITPSLKLQAEHHWYKGTARLTPLLGANTQLNDSEHWQLSAIQLTYWF